MTTNTVKIRYIGPHRDGVWTAAGAHGAHDFEHPEAIDGDGFVDVPVALAVELMGQLEPVPPGDPVWDDDTDQFVTALAPVWELEPGAELPAATKNDAESDANKPKRKPAASRSTSRAR